MAVVPDVLTRFVFFFKQKTAYEISYDWFQIAVGVLLIVQLIVLPDGVWGDLRSRAARIWSAAAFLGARRVRSHDDAARAQSHSPFRRHRRARRCLSRPQSGRDP